MTVSRQVRRQIARAEFKAWRSQTEVEVRKACGRALLERQSEREKSGAYEGRRSVAAALVPSRSRVNSRTVQKGKAFGRIIRTVGERSLHATKGWRFYS